MTVFTFDKVAEVIKQANQTNTGNKISFLKLQDDGWYAKIRFMYGPNETFMAHSVHNISKDANRPRYVACLREAGQPADVCPLCAAGNKVTAQYYMPVYVESITSVVDGRAQEEPIKQVMIFQKGPTFGGTISSIIRQCEGTPIVSNIFNLVRAGAAGSPDTRYLVEYRGRDNTTLEMLPPIPQVAGTYVLPTPDYAKMKEKYVDGVTTTNTQANQQVTPRSTMKAPSIGNQSSAF